MGVTQISVGPEGVILSYQTLGSDGNRSRQDKVLKADNYIMPINRQCKRESSNFVCQVSGAQMEVCAAVQAS